MLADTIVIGSGFLILVLIIVLIVWFVRKV